MDMKKSIKIILLFILWVTCVLLYLKFDSKQYDYGWGCTFCNKTLPYNLKPNDYYDRSFTLMDEDGFEVIGKGFRYYGSSFKVNDLLAYSYNDTSVIVKCTDSLNNIKYLTSYKTKYKNKKGNPEISFRDIDEKYFEQVKNNYLWIELDEEKGNKIRLYRTLSFVGAVLLLLILLWQLIKKRKAT